MKQKLLYCTLLSVSVALGCQAEYMSFFNPGRSWIIGESVCADKSEDAVTYRKMTVAGHEQYLGEDCFRIDVMPVEKVDGKWVEITDGQTYEPLYTLEWNGEVYQIEPRTETNPGEGRPMSKSTLLFSLTNQQPAAWTDYPDVGAYPVECELNISGEIRKCLYFPANVNRFQHAWTIEGIGMSISTIAHPNWTSDNPELPYSYIEECYQDDELIFTQQDFQDLPVPESAVIPAEAPNYFGVNDTLWKLECYSDAEPNLNPTYGGYKLNGEIEIAGKKALKLWNTAEDGSTTSMIGYIAAEGEKVYYLMPDSDEWKMLYDFGLQPGETTTIYGGNPLIFHECKTDREYEVQCIGIGRWYTTHHRTMNVRLRPISDDADDTAVRFKNDIWLCGIGNSSDPMGIDGIFWIGGGSSVKEVTSEGKIVYQRPSDNNGTGSTISIPDNTTAGTTANAPIYDLLGRKIESPLPGNLYITDGKKILWK